MAVEKNLITERIFNFFDKTQDGFIDFRELVIGMSILCMGSLDAKIEHAFIGKFKVVMVMVMVPVLVWDMIKTMIVVIVIATIF